MKEALNHLATVVGVTIADETEMDTRSESDGGMQG